MKGSSQTGPDPHRPSSRRGVGRTAVLLTPIALIARGVAFLVPVLIAHLYGVTGVTDAFFYALAFPTFLMVIVANAVGTVATPVIAQIQEDEPSALSTFLGAAATAAGVIGAVVGLCMVVILGPALPWLTEFPSETRAATWIFVAELVPFMMLTGVGVVLRAGCEVRGQFVPVAWSPLLRGSTVLIGLLALHRPLGAHALPACLILGDMVQVIWYTLILGRTGVWPRPNLHLDSRLRGTALDVLPLLVGEVLVALNVVVDKVFAGVLPPGSVSLLEYADRARFIPQTLLESTLLPVAFATWASWAAQGKQRQFAVQVDQSLRWVAGLCAAPLAGLYIGRHVLVAWLFQRGAYSAADATASAEVFGWYIPGLWSMMIGALAMRAHVVERRLLLIAGLGVVSIGLNVLFNVLLIGPMGLNGLALASTLVWFIVPAAYVVALSPTLRPVMSLQQWSQILLIAAASAALAVGVEWTGHTPRSVTDPILWTCAVVCFALLGLAFYATRSRPAD